MKRVAPPVDASREGDDNSVAWFCMLSIMLFHVTLNIDVRTLHQDWKQYIFHTNNSSSSFCQMCSSLLCTVHTVLSTSDTHLARHTHITTCEPGPVCLAPCFSSISHTWRWFCCLAMSKAGTPSCVEMEKVTVCV